MQTLRNQTIAFTGHRQIDSESVGNELFSDCRPLSVRLEEAIGNAISDGYTFFLGGMAECFDIIAGECVVRLRREHSHIKLIAVVPFSKQAERLSSDLWRARYFNLLKQSDHTLLLQQHYSHNCYYLRNDYLVDNSSRLIAYTTQGSVGTEYTVKRALRAGNSIINIY